MHETQAIHIPIIEDSPGDVERVRRLIERKDIWREAIGQNSWLNRFHIYGDWVCEELLDQPQGINNKKQAVLNALELGAPLLVLDINLSLEDEKYIDSKLNKISNELEMHSWWQSHELEKAGGLWILRELHMLRLNGFSVPAIAINSQVGNLSNNSNLSSLDFTYPAFLLEHGATWVYRKPFSEQAAHNCLVSIANTVSGSSPNLFSTKLAALYFKKKHIDKDVKLWDELQTQLLSYFDGIMEKDGISGERNKSAMIKMAYNTYRARMEKLGEKDDE